MSRAKLEALIDSAMQQIKTALLNEFDEVVKSMKKDELEKLKQKEQDVLQRQIQETKISAAIEQSRMPSGDRYFSIKEIAETLNISVANTKVRIMRAKKILAELLKNE